MAIPEADARARVAAFCRPRPRAVLFDEASDTVLDVAAGKALSLPLAQAMALEEKRNALDGSTYLVLRFEDGRQVVLCDSGIAFAALRPAGTPEDVQLPDVVCLTDFETLFAQLSHTVLDHPDEKPSRQALDMLVVCLAILTGASAVGLDIGREERKLEAVLNALEKK